MRTVKTIRDIQTRLIEFSLRIVFRTATVHRRVRKIKYAVPHPKFVLFFSIFFLFFFRFLLRYYRTKT